MNYLLVRPLSESDIRTIADYLAGTDEDLCIAMSELGFDPLLYDEDEMRDWLQAEANLTQHPETDTWKRGD